MIASLEKMATIFDAGAICSNSAAIWLYIVGPCAGDVWAGIRGNHYLKD